MRDGPVIAARRALVLAVACASCRETPAAGTAAVVPAGTVAPGPTVSAPQIASSEPEKPMNGPFAFVSTPPRTMGDLEAALRIELPEAPSAQGGMGSVMLPAGDGGAVVSSEVVRLFASYAWDVHHEKPVGSRDALRRRTLTDYSVHFARGRADCEAALRAAHGAPGAKERGTGSERATYRQYGPFFVDAGTGDAFALEWHLTAPDWPAEPVDVAARRAALQTLARALESAATPEDAGRVAVALPKNAGIAAKGTLNPGDYWIELVPPMPARDLAGALGITSPVAQSVGVHRETWRIVETTGTSTWASPRIGAWTLEPTLAAAASGGPLPGAPTGPTARRALGPADAVRSLRLVRTP